MIHTLEEQLGTITKKHLLISSGFLAMGVTAFLTLDIETVALTLAPILLSLPFVIMNTYTYFKLKNNKKDAYDSIFQKSYSNKFQNWLTSYVNQSESITEQKYKIIFTSMWMSSNKIKTTDLYDLSNKYLNVLGNKFINLKETKLNIIELFLEDRKLTYPKFFSEDENNLNKIKIAKNVYKDFESIGLVGKNFMHWSAAEILCLIPLQEYKLSLQDIIEIKKLTKKNIKTADPFKHSLGFFELSLSYCHKIILENYEHLPVLKEFFTRSSSSPKINELILLIEKTQKLVPFVLALEKALDKPVDNYKVKKI